MPAALAPSLDERFAALEKARAWSPRVIAKLEALLASEDPWALFRVNPLRFAAEKGLDEDEAIDLFLHASRQGLFKLEWHLVCPSCGDAVESFESLGNLHTHVDCKMCHMETAAKLDDLIEISFSVLQGIRDCPFHHPEALSAEDFHFKYHFNGGAKLPNGVVFADNLKGMGLGLSYLEPGKLTRFDLQIKPGFLLAWDMVRNQGFFFEIGAEAAAPGQSLDVTHTETGYWPAQGKLKAGPLALSIANHSGQRGSIMLGQLPPDHFDKKGNVELPRFLGGNRLLNNQTFRNLYRNETIGGSEGIGVTDLALLFTDLKGSTAMYERIGDIKAFALVQQHFEHLSKSVQAHHGAVVKTIGDAVMASFESGLDATKAAVDMLREIEDFNRSQGSREIMLKVGIHRGPSIAVTLNEKLDYFGQTVNVAARVQGLADAEEICVTDAIWRLPGVPEALQGLRSSVEDAEIKGLSNRLRVHRLAPPSAAKPKTAAAKPKAKAKTAPKAKKKAAPKKKTASKLKKKR